MDIPAEPFFLGVSVLTIGCGFWLLWRLQQMRAWLPVEATLTRMEMVVRHRMSRGIEGISYEPIIEYRYCAAGREFTGNRFNHVNLVVGSSRDFPEPIRDKRVGDRVTGYYNPRNPSRSCLKLPESTPPTVALIVGGFLLVLTLTLSHPPH